MVATIESYEYYGHDAVVRVRPEVDLLPELVVRVTGGSPLSTGSRVGLNVVGSVVAWPIHGTHHGSAADGHEHGDGHHTHGSRGRDLAENSRNTSR